MENLTQDKIDKVVEYLSNANYNLDNLMNGIPVGKIIKSQIENSIKILNGEELEEIF